MTINQLADEFEIESRLERETNPDEHQGEMEYLRALEDNDIEHE